jgi:quinoprotein dehydrogenase-associated probable ABC transporter substrate-binding protein
MRFPVAVRKSAKTSQKAILTLSRLAWAASKSPGLILAVLVLALMSGPTARAQQNSEVGPGDTLRVCADPGNLPFSNRKGEGFENRIAQLVASELKVPVRYYFAPQGPGFVANTLNTRLCDIIIGYASGADIVLHTNPYYRSVYVLLAKKGGELDGVTNLDDPRLPGKRLGLIAATPPVDYLVARGMIKDAQTYALLVDRRYDAPAETMLADLVAGKIDGALLWGPIGGYLAKKSQTQLAVMPLIHEKDGPELSYHITFGVRHGEQEWKHRLNAVIRARQADINRVLIEYGVPLLNDDGALIDAQGDLTGATPPHAQPRN